MAQNKFIKIVYNGNSDKAWVFNTFIEGISANTHALRLGFSIIISKKYIILRKNILSILGI